MRQLAGPKTAYRRAHATPLARLISGRAKYAMPFGKNCRYGDTPALQCPLLRSGNTNVPESPLRPGLEFREVVQSIRISKLNLLLKIQRFSAATACCRLRSMLHSSRIRTMAGKGIQFAFICKSEIATPRRSTLNTYGSSAPFAYRTKRETGLPDRSCSNHGGSQPVVH